MAEPTILLSEIPGYTPDGPVYIDGVEAYRCLAHPASWQHYTKARAALVLDATGMASLARAIGATCGLDVSCGVAWHGPRLTLCGSGRNHFNNSKYFGSDIVPALATLNPTSPTVMADALSAVARVVFTQAAAPVGSTTSTPIPPSTVTPVDAWAFRHRQKPTEAWCFSTHREHESAVQAHLTYLYHGYECGPVVRLLMPLPMPVPEKIETTVAEVVDGEA